MDQQTTATPARPFDLNRPWLPPSGDDHVAVVDVGSNSVRLVVYDRLARAPFPRFNEKALCRLGASLEATGAIAADAFMHVVDTVGRFRAIADAMRVSRIDVLGTEALRQAENGPALVDAIREASGFEVRLLSGSDEARYAGLGVVSGFHRPTGMVGDMGGGSVEIIEVVDDRVGERHVSLPLGALPVQAMLEADPQAARERIDALLKERVPPMLTTESTFYAVGGGWRTFAKAHMDREGAPVRVVHGYGIDAKAARAFAKRLWRSGLAELAALPGVAARRATTLPAAALVLDRLLKRLKPDRLVISALGLREGWLYAQLDPAEQELDALVEGARALGGMTTRVPAFSAALVRWTDGLFPGETDAARRLRVAACALSDVAWRDHPDERPREAFRRLLQFPFIGVDHAERVFLAATIHARYGGPAEDRAAAAALALLSRSQRRRALILGRMMLLGHRLSASVPEILDAARLDISTERLTLSIRKGTRVPDGDAVHARLELLARAIGVKRVEITHAEA